MILLFNEGSMLVTNEQLIIIATGVLASCFAKIFKIHPIPLRIEIIGVLIGLGVILLIHEVNPDFYSLSFAEQCRFALLGYFPGRFIWRKK